MRKLSWLLLVFLPLFSFEYVVKKGDCLWDLAGKFYKDPFLWPIIYEANKDKIRDPNLIYPWQRLEIPPYKKETKEEVTQEKEEAAEEVPKEAGISTPEAVEAPQVEPEKKIEVVSVLQKKEEEKPLVKETKIERIWMSHAEGTRLIETAGFLTIEDIHEGEIKESRGVLKNAATLHDEVLIDLGGSHGIKPGDILTIIDYGGDVSNPETGEYLGKKVFILGKVRITKTDSITSSGMVVAQYAPISLPAKVARIEFPEFPTGTPEPMGILLEGRIAGFREEKPRYRPFDVVYIVPGKDQEVKPGDVFLIYRESEDEQIPIKPCGKIQVLSVRDNYSVGYIVSVEETDLRVGERLKLVGRIK